jgi:hypothetical protein
MNDVLAVVSLVIAICGAAYMAVSAIRDHFRDEINRIRVQGAEDADEIRTARNFATRRHGDRKKRQLDRRLFFWDAVAFVPASAFLVTVYFVAIHVLVLCWSATTCEPTIWTCYRVWVIVLLSVNLVALIAIGLVYMLIEAAAEDLHAHAEAKGAERLEKSAPQNLVPKGWFGRTPETSTGDPPPAAPPSDQASPDR